MLSSFLKLKTVIHNLRKINARRYQAHLLRLRRTISFMISLTDRNQFIIEVVVAGIIADIGQKRTAAERS